jgi:exopolysaccharide biosynthesis protein
MAANTNTTTKPLYAMINADFCDQRDPSNLKPRGPVHCSGKIWQSAYNLDVDFPQQGLSYVGMTNDGKMTIGYREDYAAAKNTLKECTGAGLVLLEDSKIVGLGDVRDPRTAIGYTADNIIWILVVDGRHATSGMTYTELASILQGVGCVSAVALDGGGSTQLLGRIPSTGKIQMLNWPSDPTEGAGGEERPRLNAWAIVKK